MARLYLTYRHNDLELAKRFVSELRGRNHHVTLDQDYLVLGEEWRRALHEAFVAADGLVVLLTGNSVDVGSKIFHRNTLPPTLALPAPQANLLCPSLRPVHLFPT
jgi:hypothetical protein